MHEDKWKRLDRKNLVHSPYIDVWEDTVQLPNGVTLDDYTVVGLGNGVSIVATDSDDNLLMFREYKYALNDWLLSFPGGGVEKNETPISAAIRELLEETGYYADENSAELIGQLSVYPSKIEHINYVVRLKNVKKVENAQHEATESIGEVQKIPLSSIASLQAEGNFQATYILAALALAFPEYLARPGE